MNLIILILIAVCCYLLGSLNFAIIVSNDLNKDDVRNHGSKNAGLTNMLRTYGKHEAFLTFLGDFLKGIIPIFIVRLCLPYFGLSEFLLPVLYFSMLFIILGHSFPVYFKFKGGKGILTSAACLLAIDWRIFAIIISLFLISLLLSKIVSLSSIVGAVAAGVSGTFFIFHDNTNYPVLSCFELIFIVIFVIARHKENIKRLIRGTENKLSIGNKKQG
jgi:glycerol-3-phosphate acyltransferase PlsY